MSEEKSVVFESEASYYDQVLKKWKTGNFILKQDCIYFCHETDKNLQLMLSALTGLEKKHSCLIYAAIVVSIGSEKHWFASFSNRDSVYNLIELFWREALLSRNRRTNPAQPKSGSSNLGQELLNILHESQTALVNAANSLSDQGKQIDETLATVSDINTDLNVAEKFLRKMSSFSSFLKFRSTAGSVTEQELSKCFKVSYSVCENGPWMKGILLLTDEKLSLITEDKVTYFSVNHNDLISFKVNEKWKFCLTYSENELEKVCHVTCPKLIKLLKCLNSSALNSIITYKNDLGVLPTSQSTSVCDSATTFTLIENIKEYDSENGRRKVLKSSSFETETEQLEENKGYISEGDMVEISNVLINLQTLAAEVNKEQQEQLVKIDALMTDVEKTELRMQADTKKVKKLL